MSKTKSQQQLERINALKDRFEHLETEVIVARLTNFNRSNDIAKAYKEVLKGRGIDDYFEKTI
jgi:hypothetical protein